MGRFTDLSEHGVVGVLERHLQHPDAVTAIGHRRNHAPSALTIRFHMLSLAAQNCVVDAALQIAPLRSVRPLSLGGRAQTQ